MRIKNNKDNITLKFNLKNIVKHKIYKALLALDDYAANRGSFYKMINKERKRMGNWEII